MNTEQQSVRVEVMSMNRVRVEVTMYCPRVLAEPRRYHVEVPLISAHMFGCGLPFTAEEYFTAVDYLQERWSLSTESYS